MNELKNTDKEIWREIEGEYYSPSIFVTEQGKIGINVGGYVYVQSVEKWHQQADRIKDLEKLLEHSVGADCREMRYIQEIENRDARIAELEFENKAFRDELFKRGSMDSCSQAAALHGFVSPRQAGDDAREYIANVLKKASEK